MKIFVACEESQAVTKEFRRLGHEAYSCDIIECSGGHPEWHIQGDCLPLLNGNCRFETADGEKHEIAGRWDLLIAHPPCTYLCLSGQKHCNEAIYGEKALARQAEREKAVQFFLKCAGADCEHVAVENPVGVMSRYFRKPD
jgi:hypothetical protein